MEIVFEQKLTLNDNHTLERVYDLLNQAQNSNLAKESAYRLLSSGKNLADLNVRERFHINIIGIKQGENVMVDLDPSEPLPDNCSIIAIGKNKDLNASREELR